MEHNRDVCGKRLKEELNRDELTKACAWFVAARNILAIDTNI